MTITNQSLPLLHPHAAFYTSLPPSHALPPAGALDLPPECHQHQAHAPHLHPWGGGHDPVGRPERGRHPAQPAHQIPGEAHICGYQAVALCLRRAPRSQLLCWSELIVNFLSIRGYCWGLPQRFSWMRTFYFALVTVYLRLAFDITITLVSPLDME